MLSENLIKGQIIELKVQEELLRYGFDVSIPTYNASKYDIIADTGNELIRIQVKKAIGVTANSFKISCTTQNVKSSTGAKHKYTAGEIDYFATVWKNKVYFIPVDETSNQKTLREDGSSDIYLAKNVFSSFKRLEDEELYNYIHVGKNYCVDCGCEIKLSSERCVSCYNKNRRIVERPNREELKNLIRTTPFTQIAKKYGVTDNAVRKWCEQEKLPRKSSDIKKIAEEVWKDI